MKIQTTPSYYTHRASGPGGSHTGLFGRSTIFLSPEDPPGGSGGAPPPSDPPPGTAPAGDPPKVFTQEQVNAIAAKAREEGRQAQRTQTPPAPPPPPPAPKTPAEELAQLRTANEELALRMSFDKRAARLGLDDEASDELFELYRVQKPTDPGAWFEKKSKVFKLTTATTSGSPNADPTKTPTDPPISNKGSPAPGGDTRDIDHIVTENPVGITTVERDRLVAKHGEAKARRLIVEAGQRKAANIRVTI